MNRKAAILLLALPLVSMGAGAPRPSYPKTFSGFEGWQGVKIVRGVRCPGCCSLAFPEGFGYQDANELKLLLGIMELPDVKFDLECDTALGMDVMAHVLYLATERQDRGAAATILDADSEWGIDLGGGEMSETYAAKYLVPTLMRFQEVRKLLTRRRQTHVSRAICSSDLDPNTSGDIDLGALLTSLRSRGLRPLASKIQATCKRMEREADE